MVPRTFAEARRELESGARDGRGRTKAVGTVWHNGDLAKMAGGKEFSKSVTTTFESFVFLFL